MLEIDELKSFQNFQLNFQYQSSWMFDNSF